MVKRFRFGLFVVAALSLTLCFASTGMSAAPSGEPIVIGYAGMVLSPGTRPAMAIQKLAVQEINEAGGVLGRPLKYMIADNKGATSLTVEGARRLLMEEKAKFIFVEGRTEICLAAQENSAAMFKDYPHIMIFNGPMGSELTARIVDEYEKYKFCFRDWDPEPGHYPQMRYFWREQWPAMYPSSKRTSEKLRVAMLWEDLEWTKQWRVGIDYMNMPPWEEMMEKEFGFEVVYSKKVKPRGTMYLPLLQQIAGKKADVILYVSSWFTDTESFVKQWADSAARDIPVNLYGGVSQTSDFWKLTGGKALGVVSSFMECRFPLTDKTIPFVEMARKHKIPTQIHVHLAYADIYFIKKVIENAGGVDDIDKLIKAMETTETTCSVGKMAYEMKRVKPYFHSKIRVDLSDPLNKSIPGAYIQPMAQFQEGGKIQYIGASCEENEDIFKRVGAGTAKDFVYPAELRKRAKK
ncbi:MAG: ABC transporter substrate-binding protein [Deltaproteobacteria bacterium]|nr:ABC transporter substrate-binding protein [Deltaproteobacteria bacterium]